MVCRIVIVRVDNDEQSTAVSIIIAVACRRRIGFFREHVRGVEMVLPAGSQTVMIADCYSLRQIAECRCGKITCIFCFLLLQFVCIAVAGRFVNLVARRNEEVDFRMLRQCIVHGFIPVECIVSCRYIGGLFFTAVGRNLTFRSTNLRVTYIHKAEVMRVARFIFMHILPLTVYLYLIVICTVRFKTVSRYFIRIILYAADYSACLTSAFKFFGIFHFLIVGNSHYSIIYLRFGVPAEIQFGKI